jgi:hypothetical protein
MTSYIEASFALLTQGYQRGQGGAMGSGNTKPFPPFPQDATPVSPTTGKPLAQHNDACPFVNIISI